MGSQAFEEAMSDIKAIRQTFDRCRESGLFDFLRLIAKKSKEGKSIVFVDKKLLEWLEIQIEAGKYENRSHAIESLIQKEMQK